MKTVNVSDENFTWFKKAKILKQAELQEELSDDEFLATLLTSSYYKLKEEK